MQKICTLLFFLFIGLSLSARAYAQSNSAEAAFSETERKIDILAQELEKIRLGAVTPTVGESKHGLGPAASKVYSNKASSGVTLGGYGEMLYQNTLDGKKTWDFLRNILYVGYKFNDRFIFNAEIEVEHANEIFLEFAYLDYLFQPELNFRAGLLLIPMGLINELHEPTTYLGALRPETEQKLIPSTWRENGMGVFGQVGSLAYRAYLVSGMKASGFSDVGGLRGGRQKGSKASVHDLAGVVRVDLKAIDGLLIGASTYYGGADQDEFNDPIATLIYEAHADYKYRGLWVQALYAGAAIEGAGKLSRVNLTDNDSDTTAVGHLMRGWYVQMGYDVIAELYDTDFSLIPYFRYEELDTQYDNKRSAKWGTKNKASNRRIFSGGISLSPITQIVLKFEYQNYLDKSGNKEERFQSQLGYIF